MRRMTVKAAVVETDTEQGTFKAVASAWVADREGDVIARDAFDQTIQAWQRSGKMLPLLFEHTSEEIGAIDPRSMTPTEDGLVVGGEVDRSSEHGRQA
jgi:hypothetical protein